MVASWTTLASLAALAQSEPVKLIIDTDIGGGGCMDVDDVVALSMGHALTDLGEAQLLAVVVNTSPDRCPGAVSVLNHLYGRDDDVLIGAYKGSDLTKGRPHKYVDHLTEGWDSPIKTADQVPDGVEVYRKVLAAAPDRSVAISSVGIMTNLRALLQSEADEHSPLSGKELVAKKVKVLAAMAGSYGWARGYECNMMGSVRFWKAGFWQDHATGAAASHYVYSNWPDSVQIIFSGFEVGIQVHTGAPIYECLPDSSPIKAAFVDYVGYGKTRSSWDPLTTVMAVRGPEAVSCSFCTDCDGRIQVNANGRNEWVPGPKSNQTYLVLNDATTAAQVMDDLMCQGPKHPPAPPAPPAGVAEIVAV